MQEVFSEAQLNALRANYGRVSRVDPELPTYQKICATLDKMGQPMLEQIASANIRFVSKLAGNRLYKFQVAA